MYIKAALCNILWLFVLVHISFSEKNKTQLVNLTEEEEGRREQERGEEQSQ